MGVGINIANWSDRSESFFQLNWLLSWVFWWTLIWSWLLTSQILADIFLSFNCLFALVRVHSCWKSSSFSWEEILNRILSIHSDVLAAVNSHSSIFETTCPDFRVSTVMHEQSFACNWIFRADLLHDWLPWQLKSHPFDSHLMTLPSYEDHTLFKNVFKT